MGLYRLRLVLEFGLRMGCDVPLWPLVQSSQLWLVLVAGHGLGTVLGDVAFRDGLLRLGAVAALHSLSTGPRLHLPRWQRRLELRVWAAIQLLHVCFRRQFLPAAPALLLLSAVAGDADLQPDHDHQ